MYKNLPLKVFFGNASTHLASGICQGLEIEPGKADVDRFKDGEVYIKIHDDVRGRDIFIVNSTSAPAERNFFELCLFADAARNSSGERITMVIPYFGYGRQDKKGEPRVPLSARYICRVISISGAHRVLLLDLHAEAIVNAFDNEIIFDHLYASSVIIPYIKEKLLLHPNLLLAAPDAGAAERVEAHANRLGTDFVIFHKHRPGPNKVDPKSIIIIGDVKDRDLFFLDDMIDTGGTLLAVAKAAKKAGARKLFAGAPHGLFSDGAIRKFDRQGLYEEIIVTDSIYQDPKKIQTKNVKITILSIAPLLAEAIKRIHEGRSISELIL